MRELVDVHYAEAACIRVVQDNLSTHSAGALYEAFEPAEARRILRRLEFHYTPKHAMAFAALRPAGILKPEKKYGRRGAGALL